MRSRKSIDDVIPHRLAFWGRDILIILSKIIRTANTNFWQGYKQLEFLYIIGEQFEVSYYFKPTLTILK